jgi:hypothetical protein
MTAADVRDLARESIEELVKHFDETDPYMFCVEYHIADAILAALDAKGLAICGPGQVAVVPLGLLAAVLEDWHRFIPGTEDYDQMQECYLKAVDIDAALSTGGGQDGEERL